MVFDASKSGLNDSIWVPRFPLPTINTYISAVEPGTWMGGFNFSELPVALISSGIVRSGFDALRGKAIAKGFEGDSGWGHATDTL